MNNVKTFYSTFSVFLSISLLIAISLGATELTFKDDYRYFFNPDSEELKELSVFRETFDKKDEVLLVVETLNGDLFNNESFRHIIELTERAQQTPYSIRVDSISNFQNIVTLEDELRIENLIAHDEYSSEAMSRLRNTALAEPLLLNRLISGNGKVTAFNITLDLPGEQFNEQRTSLNHLRQIKAEYKEKYPQYRIYITGQVALNNALTECSFNDIVTLVPIMFIGIMCMMFFLLRSVYLTLIIVTLIACSVGVAIGSMGWLSIPITAPSSGAILITMTLAVANCIHILFSMQKHVSKGLIKEQAITLAIQNCSKPLAITNLTTIVGLLSMNFSDAPPFQDLGNIASIGVLSSWLLSLILLPAMVRRVPITGSVHQIVSDDMFMKLSKFIANNRKTIIIGYVILSLFFVYFASKNELNDAWLKYFGHGIEIRDDTEFVQNNLTGVYQIDFSMPSGRVDGIHDPEYLRMLDEFSVWWYEKPEVIHVDSYSDMIKRLNRDFQDGTEKFYKIPVTIEETAQLHLLYEFSLPSDYDLNSQVDFSKSTTRFTITLGDVSSNDVNRLTSMGEDWLRDNAPSTKTSATGTIVMFASISKRNIQGMLVGTFVAFLLISAILVFALGSFKYGFISLIPNLMPSIWTFGLWALFVGEINMTASIVSALTLGIVVDDTVHFLHKYLDARKGGFSAEESILAAFQRAGGALIITSFVLFVGFFIFSFSSFDVNATLGQLCAMVIVFALVTDFLLLPALLLSVDRVPETLREV